MKTTTFFFIVFFCVLSTFSAEKFELVETWNHGNEVVGPYQHSIITPGGNIVATFYKSGNRFITPQKIIAFAPMGEGPGDLMNIWALFHYKNEIAFVERPEKIKIFKREGDSYKIKKILWLRRGQYFHVVKNGMFQENKFFLAGLEMLSIDPKSKAMKASFLKVYDENGQPLKNLVEKTYAKPRQDHLMDYYVVRYKQHAFFLTENELKVHVISMDKLEILKAVQLEVPKFYKKMPEDFYTWKMYNKPGESLERDLEEWKNLYSRINKVVSTDDYIVIQVRTCSSLAENLDKFALLFYNPVSFKLEKTIFIDDLLLGYRSGRYYFFAGGDPGRDEEVKEFKINIYCIRGRK